MRFFLILIAMFTWSVSASAVPIQWSLSATFDDGGSATGTFFFDPNTTTFSSINVQTTAGTSRNGDSYSFVCVSPCTGSGPTATQVLLLGQASSSNLMGVPGFFMDFTGTLVSGGTLSINYGLEATCSNGTCVGPAAPTRQIVEGSITVLEAAAPEPATSAFVCLGALGLVATRTSRRKRQRG